MCNYLSCVPLLASDFHLKSAVGLLKRVRLYQKARSFTNIKMAIIVIVPCHQKQCFTNIEIVFLLYIDWQFSRVGVKPLSQIL